MSLPFNILMIPEDEFDHYEFRDLFLSVLTDTPEEYIETNTMISKRINEIEQKGNLKYEWELQALQAILLDRMKYHNPATFERDYLDFVERPDLESSSTITFDTINFSEDSMVVDDTDSSIEGNMKVVTTSHTYDACETEKQRHDRRKLKSKRRKQELRDPSIANSDREIAKIYAYNHFAWKQFKLKQDLDLFNFKMIKNLTSDDDNLVIDNECFKICNYSNTARCVYSKFLELATNAGLLSKNVKADDEKNFENNTNKRVVKFKFNSDGIIKYLINECNMDYLSKYLETQKESHPTGSILLNKQTKPSER
ncbi:unnamed protein product [[Candida] boidinii]|nr:unnamed protein product [[Candida] boidinii]